MKKNNEQRSSRSPRAARPTQQSNGSSYERRNTSGKPDSGERPVGKRKDKTEFSDSKPFKKFSKNTTDKSPRRSFGKKREEGDFQEKPKEVLQINPVLLTVSPVLQLKNHLHRNTPPKEISRNFLRRKQVSKDLSLNSLEKNQNEETTSLSLLEKNQNEENINPDLPAKNQEKKDISQNLPLMK